MEHCYYIVMEPVSGRDVFEHVLARKAAYRRQMCTRLFGESWMVFNLYIVLAESMVMSNCRI